MPRLSAVLIALDEVARIGGAIQSVQPWVDEVLVLDGGSSDGTVELARSLGARVERRPFDGFVSQKQHAMDLAAHPFVLSIDSDERVDEALGRSLGSAVRRLEAGAAAGAVVRRRNFLDERVLRFSGWSPDRRVRLVDRRRARWGGRDPHDRLLADGPLLSLPGALLHDPGRTTGAYLRSTVRHARTKAASLAARRRCILPPEPGLRGAAHLLRKLVLRSAWLDGRRGWTVAWVGALGTERAYRLARRRLESPT